MVCHHEAVSGRSSGGTRWGGVKQGGCSLRCRWLCSFAVAALCLVAVAPRCARCAVAGCAASLSLRCAAVAGASLSLRVARCARCPVALFSRYALELPVLRTLTRCSGLACWGGWATLRSAWSGRVALLSRYAFGLARPGARCAVAGCAASLSLRCAAVAGASLALRVARCARCPVRPP